MVVLVTGTDEKYYQNPQFKNYLKSIQDNSNFDKNVVVYLDDNTIEPEYKAINIGWLQPSKIENPNPNNCLQHGEFIKSEIFNQLDDSDVIFFTDGDMTLQRNLTEEEYTYYNSFKDNDVYVGYNKHPDDTLLDEYNRLRPYFPPEKVFSFDLSKIKVYNTGVLAMNKKTWNKISEEYGYYHNEISTLFQHYARQQWLLSFLFRIKEYNVIEMPYNIHNHTHYPSPQGTTIDENGIVKYNNKIVLFKHKWI